MQLIIKNGKVIATHEDHQDIAHLYPDTECILWSSDLPEALDEDGLPIEPDDPRSTEQKASTYQDERRVDYPSVRDQLDMIYWDQVNGTDTWRAAITATKERYPK